MDIFSPEKRSEIMRRVRSDETWPEQILRKALFSRGWRYRKNVKKLPGKPDLVFAKAKVVVFVHGCFWHQHEGCKAAARPKSRQGYWQKKLERNIARDLETQERLKKEGWRVIVIWECELQKDIDAMVERVEEVLKKQEER